MLTVAWASKVLGTIIENVYGIKLGIYVRTELGSLDVYLDGSNDGKLEGFLLGGWLGPSESKVIGSGKNMKIRSTSVELLSTIIEDV